MWVIHVGMLSYLYLSDFGSWLAWGGDTVAHYAAVHSPVLPAIANNWTCGASQQIYHHPYQLP